MGSDLSGRGVIKGNPRLQEITSGRDVDPPGCLLESRARARRSAIMTRLEQLQLGLPMGVPTVDGDAPARSNVQ